MDDLAAEIVCVPGMAEHRSGCVARLLSDEERESLSEVGNESHHVFSVARIGLSQEQRLRRYHEVYRSVTRQDSDGVFDLTYQMLNRCARRMTARANRSWFRFWYRPARFIRKGRPC